MGDDLETGGESVPQVIKNTYYKVWLSYAILLVAFAIARQISGDSLGTVNTAILAAITYCMCHDRCERMTQMSVFCYFVLSGLQFVLELTTFIGSMDGRVTEEISQHRVDDHKEVITTILQKTTLFDPTRGVYYNFQSLILVISPVVALFAIPLAWVTYKAYPRSLFGPPAEGAQAPLEDGVRPFGGYGTTLGRGEGNGGGQAGLDLAG